MKQHYDRYTNEDQLVWKTLYEQQIDQVMKYASQDYIKGMQRCNFTNDRIPNIEELNQVLLSATGWTIEIVPGLIDNFLFFKLLSEKKFPASTWMRKMESLDYLEEPDMFHDVFSHAPLLTNTQFCEFLVALANTALEFIEDENAIELISRIYWYSVEFGLIMENAELKIYGAGILSSRSETHFAIHDDLPSRIRFNVPKILQTPYVKDKFQQQYFIIDSYKELYECIVELEAILITQKKPGNPIWELGLEIPNHL
jgi:phenylalanine-4-hydroxylase